jgi:hypothetical protein
MRNSMNGKPTNKQERSWPPLSEEQQTNSIREFKRLEPELAAGKTMAELGRIEPTPPGMETHVEQQKASADERQETSPTTSTEPSNGQSSLTEAREQNLEAGLVGLRKAAKTVTAYN